MRSNEKFFMFFKLYTNNITPDMENIVGSFSEALERINFNNGNYEHKKLRSNNNINDYNNEKILNFFLITGNLYGKYTFDSGDSVFYEYCYSNVNILKNHKNIPIIYWIPTRVNNEKHILEIENTLNMLELKNKVLLINGEKCVNDRKNIKVFTTFKFHEIRYNYEIVNNMNTIIKARNNIINSNKNYNVICMNRKIKPWRSIIVSELHDKFQHDFLYSYIGGKLNVGNQDTHFITENNYLRYYSYYNNINFNDIKRKVDLIENNIPKYIDNPYYNDEQNLALIELPPIEAFKNSFCNLSNETCLYYRHFTEIPFKPIVFCQPFIINGPYGYIRYIKDMGYDVFEDIIDHSYDNERNEFKRLYKAKESAYKILSHDNKDINRIYENIKDRLLYNSDKFLNNTYKKFENELRTFLELNHGK